MIFKNILFKTELRCYWKYVLISCLRIFLSGKWEEFEGTKERELKAF